MPLLTPLPNTGTHSGWASVLLLVAPLLLGADDGYLREIEEEAKRQAATVTIDQSPPNPTAATTANMGETTADRLASGLNQAGFEQALRENLPGTYALYQQFDATRKQKVYAAYQNDNRLAGITEQVIQLLGAKP
ncbi:MAG TPA: hypothetical protein P5149_06320 [Candidatus Competibacteraceae bacterium]|nr:hypothetical protein [Candidatus Competibacteraceae bacterium]MCP5132874.1 hypothetical protein [Gammaproteobacteria bacterium]HPF58292.1 hypothetical protein [Candidatus Competibacteraceae bacterium]HRY18007.1 hypothetical protein [Candidatus Competibacteraceae bacterium]